MNREELKNKIALCVDEIEKVMQGDKTLDIAYSFAFKYNEQHEIRVSIAPNGESLQN